MKHVYRIYAADGELLYVGVSVNPSARLSAHRRWMTDDCRIQVGPPVDDLEATILERRAIICEGPRRNIQWKQWRCSTLEDAWLSAKHAALYLVGAEPRHEGYAELIVEGYGIAPIDPGTRDRTGWRSVNRQYRLTDLEAQYRTMRAEVAA